MDLSFEDRYSDLVEQGLDLAVRMGKLADSTLGTRFPGMNPWNLVVAPKYLKRRLARIGLCGPTAAGAGAVVGDAA